MKKNKPIYLTSTDTGYTYRRYPTSGQRSHRVYWQRRTATGVRYLHVDLWEKEHGEIPPKFHVHHKDHDPLNNSLENLDCLSPGEHQSHHSTNRTDEQNERQKIHLEKIRPLTKEWHKSPEGLASHSIIGKKVWENKEPRNYVCQWCEEKFQSISQQKPSYCSNGCKTKARYASGVDNIVITCPECGAERIINKYSKTPRRCRLCHNHAKRKS